MHSLRTGILAFASGYFAQVPALMGALSLVPGLAFLFLAAAASYATFAYFKD
jgi:hypothetical protein